MCTFRVSRKLHLFIILQLQHLLESTPNPHQYPRRLLRAPPFASGNIPIAHTGNTLAHSLRPYPDPIERFSNIDNHAHDFAVAFVFEGFTDSAEHDVEPEFVNGDVTAVFELVGPFATVFVLSIFPFWTDAAFEEVVVGFQSEV